MVEPVDLTERSDCLLEIYAQADLGPAGLLALETSEDGSRWSLRVGATGFSLSGSTEGEFEQYSVPLTREVGKEVYFGFRMRDTVDDPTGDGVYIDDVTIACQKFSHHYRGQGWQVMGCLKESCFPCGGHARIDRDFVQITT